MKNTTQTVTKGRIVFFQTKAMAEDGIEPYAAIVTRVFDNDVIGLTIIPPEAHPFTRRRVEYFDGFDKDTPGQDMAWWWPPMV